MFVRVETFDSPIAREIQVQYEPSDSDLEVFHADQLKKMGIDLQPWEVEERLYQASKNPKFDPWNLISPYDYYWKCLQKRLSCHKKMSAYR